MLTEQDELLVVDTGSHDNTPEVVEKLGGRCIRRPDLLMQMNGQIHEWIPEWEEQALKLNQISGGILRSFAEAREIARLEAKNDIQFWIDCDDTFEEEIPGKLREVLEKDFFQKELSQIFLDYDYAHDDFGNCTVRQKRERVFVRDQFEWKGPCHETLIPKDGRFRGNSAYYKDLKSKIVHHRKENQSRSADIRNYLILRNAIEEELKEREWADTRLYYYYAQACRGLSRFKEAIDYYKLTLQRSGSQDDCFSSALTIAILYLTEKYFSPAQALHWAHEAIKINDFDPRGYFLCQHANVLLRRWEESLWWFEIGRQLPEPMLSIHIYEPNMIQVTPWILCALANKELGRRAEALQAVEYLKQIRGGTPDIEALGEEIQNWNAAKIIGQALLSLTSNSGAQTEEQTFRKMRELCGHLQIVPADIEQRGISKKEPEDTRTGEEIVFFCGKTPEEWGPQSVVSGHGGSERAIYEVSRILAQDGRRITVYNSCPKSERGIDDKGVLWRHFSEFDRERPRPTIVYWRSPSMLSLPFPADRRFLWCHDVQDANQWGKVEVALVDKCLVLSEYHKTTLGGKLPDDKILVTRNGIDSDLFRRKLKEKTKNPKKIIFTSSPERGILTALHAFKVAHKKDPELEFHAFYGFTRLFFDRIQQNWAMHICDLACEMQILEYMRQVGEEIEQTPGAYNHGRVGWEEMAEHFAEAGIWLYPTRFPEISCISAMEAQAGGCCLVTTDYAALAETVDWKSGLSWKVVPDNQEGTAAAVLAASEVSANDDRRAKMSEKALEGFSWESVAKSWIPIFLAEDP